MLLMLKEVTVLWHDALPEGNHIPGVIRRGSNIRVYPMYLSISNITFDIQPFYPVKSYLIPLRYPMILTMPYLSTIFTQRYPFISFIITVHLHSLYPFISFYIHIHPLLSFACQVLCHPLALAPWGCFVLLKGEHSVHTSR